MLTIRAVVTALALLVPGTVGAVRVQLAWDYADGATPAVSFSVYRDVGCTGTPLWLATTPRPQLTYTDGPLTVGTYCYSVTAVAASGEESTPSNVLTFSVPAAAPPPAAPTQLRGQVVP